MENEPVILISDWQEAEEKPGYRRKIVRKGQATINIYRPILTPEEYAKREAEVKRDLERAFRDIYRREAREAAAAAAAAPIAG